MFNWLKRWIRPGRQMPPATLPIDPALFDQDGASLYAALGGRWASSDPFIYTRHRTRAAADALEQRYALRLPEDFRAYLGHAAPAATFMDDFGTQWWGVADIKPLSEECADWKAEDIGRTIMAESGAYLVFADYLLWCYAWAICCSDGPNRGRIALIGGGRDAFVADDFRTFVRMALVDDVTIHQAPGRRGNTDGR
ncbi:SMI1/KNR4 family protein [Sphingomonas sp. VNH70]|uniref:SMI1/KNR4 family protein n=1 Tax=Sphingomonas silueang TaxID=3156617 RepID=UPI0032B45FAC